MASSAPNRSLVARAAAILTTAEVAAASVDLNEGWGDGISVGLDFTLGSLTNVVVRFYVSMDATTWYTLRGSTAAALAATETAGGNFAYAMESLAGWKFFRASVQGTGTVTSSSATLTYRYLRRGSQG